eukprot:2790773-Rhodomonas_salina.1
MAGRERTGRPDSTIRYVSTGHREASAWDDTGPQSLDGSAMPVEGARVLQPLMESELGGAAQKWSYALY